MISIKNPELLRKFEDEQTRNDEMSYEQKLLLLNSIYRYAVKMGILPHKNPLEGIEEKIRVKKILNSLESKDCK